MTWVLQKVFTGGLFDQKEAEMTRTGKGLDGNKGLSSTPHSYITFPFSNPKRKPVWTQSRVTVMKTRYTEIGTLHRQRMDILLRL